MFDQKPYYLGGVPDPVTVATKRPTDLHFSYLDDSYKPSSFPPACWEGKHLEHLPL